MLRLNALSAATESALADVRLPVDEVRRVVETALAEDLAHGPDVTTEAIIPGDATAYAAISAREPGVVAGVPIALAVFDAVLGAGEYRLVDRAQDGAEVDAGADVLVLRGPVRRLLTAERTALNLLCHLSGIATATARWVDELAGTGTQVRDSRKTLPGLRVLAKYAVRQGGGTNHRMALGDAVLIKDNHVAAAGSVSAAITAVREHAPHLPWQVEVDTLAQLDEALAAGAPEIMLDNFTTADCGRAVARVRATGRRVRLEASGGIGLDVARTYAETGVDFLAVGGLTHSVPALDLGLDLRTGNGGTSHGC
ncbi:carboxylating nicotinate-nucleotide diphosphorylase [Saccharopolyspora gloriosae]|uniref:carboxylating nicotinate-nucleotide diphosphorylase n=1 Tax=Saccharopolyspora gloriosae TaxID=455344 RepID=UPI001FB62F78|nr:carboxylating nicotinate-nucleotide diphosphorylase [Saccharopolyspora gloriosae]